jgi:hypothetical protein
MSKIGKGEISEKNLLAPEFSSINLKSEELIRYK